jgi:hypothetical protein
MSNYIKATNFATKDTLATGNPSKIVKGTEIDAEFTAIASAVSSKANINAPVFTGSVTLPGAPTTGLHATTKDYVDTLVGTLGTMASQSASAVAITGGSISSIREKATVNASAPASSINYDFSTQAVLVYTSNATNNFTVNVRGSSSVSLNTLLAVGESATMVLMISNGATPYYPTTIQIDGTTITPKYQGGLTVTAGNPNSIDVYTLTVLKTASATYTAFISQTKFA